ncbi:MAG: hypothetical protein JW846_01560 [Dehalococcoidia bacterium]|nr:hypothetical protein [Dehalococcoidia bacterium]
MNVTQNLKTKMASGDSVHVVLVGPGNEPFPTVQALKTMGFDVVMIDREHSLVNPETIYAYVRAGKELDMPITVRPEENDADWRCLLDSGVSGLMLSMVDTVEEAARAVDRAYFPPLGHRGYGLGMCPLPLDGLDPNIVPHLEMTGYINNNTLLLPQTESLKAISNLRRILALDGVDGTVVGTFDLALDIGGIPEGASRLEMTRSAAVEAALAEIARICKEQGKIAGIGGVPPEDMARWATQGYRLFIYGTVTDGNMDSVRATLEKTKKLLGE